MRILIIFLILFFSFPLAAQPMQRQFSALEHVVEATALMRRVDATENLSQRVEILKEALNRLRKVIEEFPKSNAAAQLRSGKGFVVLGEKNLTLEHVASRLASAQKEFCSLKSAQNCMLVKDVPLMPGLLERKADRVIVNTPVGRVLETTTIGLVARTGVQDFYLKSLPKHGWRKVEPMVFKRGGERLTINFPQDDSEESKKPNKARITPTFLKVRYVIRPSSEFSSDHKVEK